MSVQEALARAIDEALYPFAPQLTDEEARAVVASLREQGLAVVPREDIRLVLDGLDEAGNALVSEVDVRTETWEAADRLLAALTAPGDGGEG